MKTVARAAFEKRQREVRMATSKLIAVLVTGFVVFVATMVYFYGIY